MRRVVFISFFVTAIAWSAAVKAEYAALKSLLGEWHQIASNAGACIDCRIVVGKNGADFSVKSNNGWSATVRQSFQGKPFIAGEGTWDSNVTGVYKGKPFFLNLGIKEDQLLMLMTVPGRNGALQNIEAIFERGAN